MTDGTTVGIWVGDDESLVEDFDKQLGHPPDYSRSRSIKSAMRMYLTIDGALDDIGYDFPNERAKRAFVRQAIMTQARVERDE